MPNEQSIIIHERTNLSLTVWCSLNDADSYLRYCEEGLELESGMFNYFVRYNV